MVGRTCCYPLHVLRHPLVITIKEIHLESLDAPSGVMLHRLVHILHHITPRAPQDDVHMMLLAIVDQRFQIDLFVDGKQIVGIAPSLVDDNIGDAVGLREIDEIFVGRGVHARAETHPRDICVIPPVPGHQSGLNPRRIFYLTGLRQALRHVVVQQLRIVLGDEHHSPR